MKFSMRDDTCVNLGTAFESLEPRTLMAFAFSDPLQSAATGLDRNGSTVSADFDRDGNADLAVTSGSSIGFLKGNGDGTFQDPVWTTQASRVGGLKLGMDDDGSAVVFAIGGVNPQSPTSQNFRSAAVRRFAFDDGRGGFVRTGQAVVRGVEPTRLPIGSAAVGDLVGDGHADIVVDFLRGTPTLIRTTTTGELAVVRYLRGPNGGAQAVKSVAIADLNGDGRNDVVIQRFAGLGDGVGGPRPRVFLSSPESLDRNSTTLKLDPAQLWQFADVNSDGRADAIALVRTSPISSASVPRVATFDVRVRLTPALIRNGAISPGAAQSGGSFSIGEGTGSIQVTNPGAESVNEDLRFELVAGTGLGALGGVGILVERSVSYTSRSGDDIRWTYVSALQSVSITSPQAGTLAYADVRDRTVATPATGGVRLTSPLVDVDGDGLLDSVRNDGTGLSVFRGQII